MNKLNIQLIVINTLLYTNVYTKLIISIVIYRNNFHGTKIDLEQIKGHHTIEKKKKKTNYDEMLNSLKS